MKSNWKPFLLLCLGWAVIGLLVAGFTSLHIMAKGTFSLVFALTFSFGMPIALWLSICWAISYNGWSQLAKKYRAEGTPGGKSYHCLALGCMGSFSLTYNNCVRIYFSPEGVGLKMNFIFRFCHPPLLIPWKKIKSWESLTVWGFIPVTRLHVEGMKQTVSIYWKAGKISAKELATHEVEKSGSKP